VWPILDPVGMQCRKTQVSARFFEMTAPLEMDCQLRGTLGRGLTILDLESEGDSRMCLLPLRWRHSLVKRLLIGDMCELVGAPGRRLVRPYSLDQAKTRA
jgi:hypothetical protein